MNESDQDTLLESCGSAVTRVCKAAGRGCGAPPQPSINEAWVEYLLLPSKTCSLVMSVLLCLRSSTVKFRNGYGPSGSSG